MDAISKEKLVSKVEKVLVWYNNHRRQLPWRSPPGELANPYHVWLSEVMLQQTTVATVKPYFEHFLKIWPEIDRLAAASLDDVLHAWQGLGYYARARNLHRCANVVTSQYGGHFPEDGKELIGLPGVGPYTAAAIAAIAFGKKATPVDGNIERVITRVFAIMEPLPKSKVRLVELAGAMTPETRAGDYAQALMDIGATICIPKKPLCCICPLSGECLAEARGLANNLPYRIPKKKKPIRIGMVFWLFNSYGEILLRRRPDTGLLGGMIEVPSSKWQEEIRSIADTLTEAPVDTRWRFLPGKVRHTFTHFRLELVVAVGQYAPSETIEGIWCGVSDFGQYALPTLMKKVVMHVQKYEG
jgi:A/G-specific adenine glycosylase